VLNVQSGFLILRKISKAAVNPFWLDSTGSHNL